MPTLSILFLGDATRSEFRRSRLELNRWGVVGEYVDVGSAAAALDRGQIAPDVILIAQAFPGQFSAESVDRLRRLAPLASVMGLLGSWCEGEMRSGEPWPAALRTYWHQSPGRCRREFERLVRGEPCSLALPVTAGEEERVLANMEIQRRGEPTRRLNDGATAGIVMIRSTSREMWAWLSAACQNRGFATVWRQDAAMDCREEAAAAIFDATDLGPAECDELRRMSAAVQPAGVIVLLSFPRIEQERLARECGAAAMLSKPVNVEDLLGALEAMGSALSF